MAADKAVSGAERNRRYMQRKEEEGYKRVTVWVLDADVSAFWAAYKKLQKKWNSVNE